MGIDNWIKDMVDMNRDGLKVVEELDEEEQMAYDIYDMISSYDDKSFIMNALNDTKTNENMKRLLKCLNDMYSDITEKMDRIAKNLI